MPEIICPKCGTKNKPEAEQCIACRAPLAAIIDEGQAASEPNTSEDLTLHATEGQDLPDLLKSLKQDGEISSDGELFEDQNTRLRPDPGELDSADTAEDDLPGWLRRIRERARQEGDAAGEITQKISAAQDSLASGRSVEQHENFAAWIESLRGDSGSEPARLPAEQRGDEQSDAEDVEGSAEWLDRVRKLKGPSPQDGEASESGRKGDSLLQWLVALEEGRENLEPVRQAPEPQAEPTDIGEPVKPGEATQKIPVTASHQQEPPAVDASREEQLQANLFSSMIIDESAGRPIREPGHGKGSWAVRLILALLLVGVLSAALWLGWTGGTPGRETPLFPTRMDFPEEASLLLVAEYQAGFSEEIHAVARPVLLEALPAESQISLVSAEPAGLLLARDLLTGLPEAQYFSIIDIGYMPSSALAAYAVATHAGAALPWEGPLAALPSTLDGVFILADSYEGARFWVEQLSVLHPDVPLYLLVTAQAGPMLTPYQDSGQVAGMAAGISSSDLPQESTTENGLALHLRSAYQTGTLLLAIVMTAGALLFGRPKRSESGGKEGEHHELE